MKCGWSPAELTLRTWKYFGGGCEVLQRLLHLLVLPPKELLLEAAKFGLYEEVRSMLVKAGDGSYITEHQGVE